jgi:hypothetical protein
VTTSGTLTVLNTPINQTGQIAAGAHTWNPAWDAEVQSEVQDAIELNHLDHLLAADYDPASKPGVSTALLNELIGSDGGVSQFTANALELAPSSSTALASGTVASTTGTTTTLDTGSVANADYHTGSSLVLTSGTGAGQERIITAWSAGRVATHEAWDVNPDNATGYQIRSGRSSATLSSGGDATATNQATIIKLLQSKTRVR